MCTDAIVAAADVTKVLMKVAMVIATVMVMVLKGLGRGMVTNRG